MACNMIILAIDCAASLCAASVYDAAAAREVGREVRDLGKGHAEHLMDVIGTALGAAGKSYGDLGAIRAATFTTTQCWRSAMNRSGTPSAGSCR